ncbi:MAG: MFS transporter [Thermodesulfobacteriota bacterium]
MDPEPPSREKPRGFHPGFNFKVLFGLFLVHFTGDFYISFVNPLLPELANRLSLTLTEVGLLTGLNRFLAFVVQPSVGYLADRFRTRFFLIGGPLLAVLFVPLIGVAGSFWTALLFLAIGSIGSSMLHPSSAGMVPAYSGPNLSFFMAFYNLGGTLAFGLGPLFAAWYVTRFGLATLPYSALLGLVGVVAMLGLVPRPEGEGLKNVGFFRSVQMALGPAWKTIALIWIIVVLRVFVSQSINTFGPMLFAREGHSLMSIGTIISAYLVGGAISGLVFGGLADRLGYKPIFLATYALATPALHLFLVLPGQWIYAGSFAAGFFTLATMPLAVSMAQEMAPQGSSIVASLMMGLAFGTGGMMTPITGWLCDIFNLRDVLLTVVWLPLLAIVLIYRLPSNPAANAPAC